MKNICNYAPEKYNDPKYKKIEENIYKIEGRTMLGTMFDGVYVTSLTFEQEPEFGEGESPSDISQYPLEEILDEFGAWVEDFYDEENRNSEVTCYQEFASYDLDDIKRLRTIIGKHVYMEVDGDTYGPLIIE